MLQFFKYLLLIFFNAVPIALQSVVQLLKGCFCILKTAVIGSIGSHAGGIRFLQLLLRLFKGVFQVTVVLQRIFIRQLFIIIIYFRFQHLNITVKKLNFLLQPVCRRSKGPGCRVRFRFGGAVGTLRAPGLCIIIASGIRKLQLRFRFCLLKLPPDGVDAVPGNFKEWIALLHPLSLHGIDLLYLKITACFLILPIIVVLLRIINFQLIVYMALLQGNASAFHDPLDQIALLHLAFLINYGVPMQIRADENSIYAHAGQHEECQDCKQQPDNKFFTRVFLLH